MTGSVWSALAWFVVVRDGMEGAFGEPTGLIGCRRAGDSRGAECATGLIPHHATGIQAVMILGKVNH